MRPDEAFGLIFMWDNVIANTRELQRGAWRAVAQAEGLPFPSVDRPQLYDLRPERAAMDVSAPQRPPAPCSCCQGPWRAGGWLALACRGGCGLRAPAVARAAAPPSKLLSAAWGCRLRDCPRAPPSSARHPAAQVLMWTRDWKRAQELAWLVATEYARLLMDTAQPLDGVDDWLQVRHGVEGLSGRVEWKG